MEQKQKERLVGATVLIIVSVIFIPMILDDTTRTEKVIKETNIPPRPEVQFNSKIIPVTDPEKEHSDIVNDSLTDSSEQLTIPEPDSEDKTSIISQPVAEVETGDDLRHTTGDNIDEKIGLNAWAVQLGSFNNEENAHSLKKELRENGFPAFVEPYMQEGKKLYRVRVGPEIKRSDATALLEKIKQSVKKEGIVVSYP